MRTQSGVLVSLLLLSLPVMAQIGPSKSFSATARCAVASVHQTVTVEDEGKHSISIDQRECRFDSPVDFGGVQVLKYVATGVDDVQWDKSRDRGYAVGESAKGDKYFLRYEGAATLENGRPLRLEGIWKFTGGTGKLQGLTGEGSYTAHPTNDGGMVFAIEGRYHLPVRAKIGGTLYRPLGKDR